MSEKVVDPVEVIKNAYMKVDQFLNIAQKKTKVTETVEKLTGSAQWCSSGVDYDTGVVWCAKKLPFSLEADYIVSFITHEKGVLSQLELYVSTEPISPESDKIDIVDLTRVSIVFENSIIRRISDDEFELYVPLPQREGIYPYIVFRIQKNEEYEDDP